MMPNELTVQIDELITKSAGQFVSTISQYQWDIIPDSQLQAAKAALTKSDYIMKIASNDSAAVHDSLIKAAILGLDLTEGKRQGWLLPRKNQQGKTVIVLQTGYKGVEAIHQRMGVIDRLTIRVVHENDIFTWTGNDQDKPEHVGSDDGSTPNWFASDEKRGPIKGAFSITYFPDGHIHVMVTSVDEIYEKHRNASDSWKSYETKKRNGQNAFPPPWVAYEKAMVEKTMAYIAAKQWPANIRDDARSSKILETLHEIDIADYSWHTYTPEQKKAFTDFFEQKDQLGLFLFTQRFDIELVNELHGELIKVVPRGGKGKKRTEFKEMTDTGRALMDEIILALSTDDEARLIEAMEGSLFVTSKLVKSNLNDVQKKQFIEIMERDDDEINPKETD